MNKVLTKQSSEGEIKNYFTQILKLSQIDEKFPVDLDEVWMLVYSQKGKAIKSLKENFIEGEDFNLYQMGKVVNSNEIANGIAYDAHLSVSCLEYFIARKVRPVFEVYRQVFHKVAEQKVLSPAEQLLRNAQLLVEQEKRLNKVEEKVLQIEAKTQTRPDYFTIVGYGTLHGISVNLKQASSLGRRASDLCKIRGIETDRIPDPRFGQVKMYPVAVLEEVFNQPLTKGGVAV